MFPYELNWERIDQGQPTDLSGIEDGTIEWNCEEVHSSDINWSNKCILKSDYLIGYVGGVPVIIDEYDDTIYAYEAPKGTIFQDARRDLWQVV